MAEYISYDKEVEVRGDAVISFVDGMEDLREIGLKILRKFGIENPEAGKWYSQQKWLYALEEISKKVGSSTLNVIGRKIPETAIFPPNVNSVAQILSLLNTAYHSNHRGGEIGVYKFESISDNSGFMLCNNSYPCDFDQGLILSLIKKYNKKDGCVKISHANEECRKNGDDLCTYFIEWS